MSDDFKRMIEGYGRGGGCRSAKGAKTCPCCRETQSKRRSRQLARKRLKARDRKDWTRRIR